MLAEQSVKRDESVPELCPSCGAANAQALTRIGLCVYLSCENCHQVWSIPERRLLPRATDKTRVF
jgi:hypothetical protein